MTTFSINPSKKIIFLTIKKAKKNIFIKKMTWKPPEFKCQEKNIKEYKKIMKWKCFRRLWQINKNHINIHNKQQLWQAITDIVRNYLIFFILDPYILFICMFVYVIWNKFMWELYSTASWIEYERKGNWIHPGFRIGKQTNKQSNI